MGSSSWIDGLEIGLVELLDQVGGVLRERMMENTYRYSGRSCIDINICKLNL